MKKSDRPFPINKKAIALLLIKKKAKKRSPSYREDKKRCPLFSQPGKQRSPLTSQVKKAIASYR
jgi:hypothetical protein